MSASNSSRPTCADLWGQAAASLSEEDRASLGFHHRGRLEILSGLLDLINKEIQRRETQQLSFTRKSGEKVFVRHLFAKVVRCIERFKEVGDVAVQYDPAVAALPWAGIRFLLEVIVSDLNATELILEHATSLAEIIPRYAIFEQLFLQSASLAASELKRALTGLYSSVLLYLAKAKTYFTQHISKRSAKNVLLMNPNFDEQFERILNSQVAVDRCAVIVELQGALDRHTELKAILSDLDSPVKRVDQAMQHIKDDLDESERNDILQWVSSEPYEEHHNQARSDFLSGTGKWLLADPVFKKWRDESASSILWLHGIPGSGKSKLVSAVVEDVLESSQSGQCPPPVYFYCSRNPAEPGRSSPSGIVASVARQLSSASPNGPLLPPVIAKYREQKKKGFAGGRLNLAGSLSLTLKLLSLYPMATIIIDALDECDPETRGDLLDFFTSILQNSACLVKIFVSSRNDGDIVYRLGGYPNMELSSEKNSADIELFVQAETDRLIARGSLFRSSANKTDMRKAVVEKVANDANGMFRWASLQLQALCQLKTDQAIRERLGKNPPKLDELYQEIMDSIQRYPAEADKQYALRAFRWLLYAQRRLTMEEFLSLVSIPLGSATTRICLEQVLDLCRNLVIFDDTIGTFRFAHLSVREFLEKQPTLDAESSHGLAAEACLLSLISRPDEKTWAFLSRWDHSTYQRDILPNIYDYAAFYWAIHCQCAGSVRLRGALNDFLSYFMAHNTDRRSPFRLWQIFLLIRYVMFPSGMNYRLSGQLRECCFHVSPVFTACCFDLHERVRWGPKDIPNGYVEASFRGTLIKAAFRYDAKHCLDQFMSKPGQLIDRHILMVALLEGTSKIVASLFDQQSEQLQLTGASIAYAARNFHKDEKVMKVLLSRMKPPPKVSTGIIRNILSSDFFGQSAVRLLRLIQSYDPVHFKSQLSTSVLKSAIQISGAEALEFLLQQGLDSTYITPALIETAINEHNACIKVEMLIKYYGDNIMVSDSMITAACANLNEAEGLIEILIKSSKNPVPMTENIIVDACPNPGHRAEWLRYLFDQSPVRLPLTARILVDAYDYWHQFGGMFPLFSFDTWERLTLRAKMGMVYMTAQRQGATIVRNLLARHDVAITEHVLMTAGSNSNGGFEILDILCNRSAPQLRVTERLLRSTVLNGELRSLELLLRRNGGMAICNPKILHKTAKKNILHGYEMIRKLLADTIPVAESLLVGEAQYGSYDSLLALLKMGGKLTTDVLIAAAQGCRSPDVTSLISLFSLLPSARSHVSEYFIMAVAHRDYKPMLLNFLQKESILCSQYAECGLMAASQMRDGPKVIDYILHHYSEAICITPTVIRAACLSNCEHLRYLLRRSTRQIPIDNDMLCRAASNTLNYGGRSKPSVFTVLLNYQPKGLQVTEDLLITAASNAKFGKDIIRLLWDRCKDEVHFTQKVLQAAIRWKNFGLVTDLDYEILITDETLAFAARYSSKEDLADLLFARAVVQWMDDGRKGMVVTADYQITEGIWLGAALNRRDAQTLSWLLDEHAGHIYITPKLVAAAASNANAGDEMISLLLKKCPRETLSAIDDRVLLAAAGSGQMGLLTVFRDEYGLHPADEHWGIAALYNAVNKGDLLAVRALLEQGIHPDHRDHACQTPLSIACKNGYGEIAQVLLETGLVDVNAQDDEGATPLLLASHGIRTQYIMPCCDLSRLLLKAGANPTIKDCRGITPYSIAELKGDYITLRRLREESQVWVTNVNVVWLFAFDGFNESAFNVCQSSPSGRYDDVEYKSKETAKASFQLRAIFGFARKLAFARNGHERWGVIFHEACWGLLQEFAYPRPVDGTVDTLKLSFISTPAFRYHFIDWGHGYGSIYERSPARTVGGDGTLGSLKGYYNLEFTEDEVHQCDPIYILGISALLAQEQKNSGNWDKTSSMASAQHELQDTNDVSDLFCSLPREVLDMILILLPSKDVLNLKLASRTTAASSLSQAF